MSIEVTATVPLTLENYETTMRLLETINQCML